MFEGLIQYCKLFHASWLIRSHLLHGIINSADKKCLSLYSVVCKILFKYAYYQFDVYNNWVIMFICLEYKLCLKPRFVVEFVALESYMPIEMHRKVKIFLLMLQLKLLYSFRWKVKLIQCTKKYLVNDDYIGKMCILKKKYNYFVLIPGSLFYLV